MKKVTLATALICLIWLAGSLWHWTRQPNNFLYTVETTGRWGHKELRNYKARGFHMKLNPGCAENIYAKLTIPPNQTSSHDFKRFSKNRKENIVFWPEEISTPSRFKWHSEDYITYDDPGLTGGIRYSFRNRCLYDRECSFRDSADYLYIKIGVRYFLDKVQLEELDKCVTAKEMFYQIENNYNFGRSDRHHRNGILLWLGDRLTALPLAVLFFLVIV